MKKEEGRGEEGFLLIYSLTILIAMKKEEGRKRGGKEEGRRRKERSNQRH